MSHLFVELWSERPAWRAMDVASRAAFLERVAAAVAPVLAKDIACLAAGHLEGEGPRHVAVWRAADPSLVDQLRAALRSAGWYELFDQQDLAGPESSLGAILEGHADEPAN